MQQILEIGPLDYINTMPPVLGPETQQHLREAVNMPWVWVSGKSGSGKTHLLVWQSQQSRQGGQQGQYFSLKNWHHQQPPNSLLNHQAWWFLDDFEAILSLPEILQQQLQQWLLQHFAQGGKLWIACQSLPQDERWKIFLQGLPFPWVMPLPALQDQQQRQAALRAHAQALKIHLPQSVVRYLFQHITDDLEEALAFVAIFDERSRLEHQKITLPNVKRWLG